MEAVIELSACPVLVKEAIIKLSVCPLLAKEVIIELSACPMLAKEAVIEFESACAIQFFSPVSKGLPLALRLIFHWLHLAAWIRLRLPVRQLCPGVSTL